MGRKDVSKMIRFERKQKLYYGEEAIFAHVFERK